MKLHRQILPFRFFLPCPSPTLRTRSRWHARQVPVHPVLLQAHRGFVQVSNEPVGVKPIKLPARSPNLNSYCERWLRSIKEECLSQLILFGEPALRRVLDQFEAISTTNDLIRVKATQFCFR